MDGMKALAIELRTIYRQEKQRGKNPQFPKIIERLYERNKHIFPEYNLSQFKSAIILKHNEIKKVRASQLKGHIISHELILHHPFNRKRKSDKVPDEGDGQLFTLFQIEELGLDSNSYV